MDHLAKELVDAEPIASDAAAAKAEVDKKCAKAARDAEKMKEEAAFQKEIHTLPKEPEQQPQERRKRRGEGKGKGKTEPADDSKSTPSEAEIDRKMKDPKVLHAKDLRHKA